MTDLLDFPLPSLWYTLFFLQVLFSWRNSSIKIASFENFQKTQKRAILYDKIRIIKSSNVYLGEVPCCSIFRWLCRGILHFFWGPNESGAMIRSPPTSNHNFCAVFSNSCAVLSNSCGLKQFTVHSKSSKQTPSFFSFAVFRVLY